MKEFDAIIGHHKGFHVVDQLLVDRLFALDLRLIEIKNIAMAFMDASKNKELMGYINKSKNPNKRGSGGTQTFNPVSNTSKETGLIYAALAKHVDALSNSFRQQITEENPLLMGHRLTLIAALEVWEDFKNCEFIEKKKIRMIDMLNVMVFRIRGDWQSLSCKICKSSYPVHNESPTACAVCASARNSKAPKRSRGFHKDQLELA